MFVWVVKEGYGDGENYFEFFDFVMSFGGGYFGVEMIELMDLLCDYFGVLCGEGVMIVVVEEGSFVEVVGFCVVDVVMLVNGDIVCGQCDFGCFVCVFELGIIVDFEVWCDCWFEQISVVVVECECNVFKIGENGIVCIQVYGDVDVDVQVFYDEFEGLVFEKLCEFIGSGEWLMWIESIEGFDFEVFQECMKEFEKEFVEIEVKLYEIDFEEEDG